MTLEEERRKSLELWDRMATGWEKHNDYVWDATREVGTWLVDHVEPAPGNTILEIAAGPGDTGFVAAGLVGDEGKLISTDFAGDMMRAAEARAQSLGVANAEFRVMDAENMELPDDSVDGVLCRWGLMLMLDPAAALRETRRVLRPGGKAAFSVWGRPADNPWVTLMGMVLTQQGRPPQSDPFGPGGMFSMAEHETVHQLVTAAGFDRVEIENMDLRWAFDDFDEFWMFQTELAGAISVLISGMDDDEVAGLKKDVEAALEPFRSGGGYEFPARTVNVAAS